MLYIADEVDTLIPTRLDSGGFIFEVTVDKALLVPVTLRFIYTEVGTNDTLSDESEAYFNTTTMNFVDFRPLFQRFRVMVALESEEITGPFFTLDSELGECVSTLLWLAV